MSPLGSSLDQGGALHIRGLLSYEIPNLPDCVCWSLFRCQNTLFLCHISPTDEAAATGDIVSMKPLTWSAPRRDISK